MFTITIKTKLHEPFWLLCSTVTNQPSPWIKGQWFGIQTWVIIYFSCINVYSPSFRNNITWKNKGKVVRLAVFIILLVGEHKRNNEKKEKELWISSHCKIFISTIFEKNNKRVKSCNKSRTADRLFWLAWQVFRVDHDMVGSFRGR